MVRHRAGTPEGVDYTKTDAGGVQAMWAAPEQSLEDRVLFCIHGGGFVSGSIYTHRKLFAHLAKATGARPLIIGYTLLPGGAHPAPLEEALAAYRWLLDQGIDPGQVAFAADSAGGQLSISAQLFSSTLEGTHWSNSRVVRGDVPTEVRRMKEQDGKDLILYGHGPTWWSGGRLRNR